jgi:hypothetical protein
MHHYSRPAAGHHAIGAVILLLSFLVMGCAPTYYEHEPIPEVTYQPPPPSTRVYFYPNKGQSPAQQDFDHYQCYLWAVKQTGFNPSAPYLAPHQQLEVVPHPPAGHDTAVGAATGAIIGAIAAPRGKTAAGVVIGAATGAVVGAASDAARQAEAERVRQNYARLSARKRSILEEQAADYRRAMAACLEGRGYTVSSEEE